MQKSGANCYWLACSLDHCQRARSRSRKLTRCSLARWRPYGLSHQGVLAIKRGDIAAGLRRLTSGLGDANSSFRFSMYLSDMVEALGRIGRVGQGLSALEVAIEQAEETEERWSIAELLRIKGELLLLQGAPGAAAVA